MSAYSYSERVATIKDYINLVLRHPERLDEVADILAQRSFTMWQDATGSHNLTRGTSENVTYKIASPKSPEVHQ